MGVGFVRISKLYAGVEIPLRSFPAQDVVAPSGERGEEARARTRTFMSSPC